MENFKKSNELLEAIANGVAFDKETGLIWEHWLNSVTEQVEKNNLELCGGECSNENSGLHKHFVNVRYLLIEWINGNPVIDGCLHFDTKDECLEYWRKLPKVNGVTYTVCESHNAR